MANDQDGYAIALERIAVEAEARTGFLDLGCLGLTALPAELFALTHLRRLNLGRWFHDADGVPWESQSELADNEIEAELPKLGRLPCLAELSLRGCRISNLAGLASVTTLQSLDCAGTQVADLAPLASLAALQSLRCSWTQVSDLAPLASLAALRSLDCSYTEVADLAPFAGLAALQSLNCSWTRVADLAPLAGLPALQSLDCSDTQVADLAPLASLAALQSLNCSRTRVANLAPLASLAALQSLSCSETQVADLAPLAGLATLQSLHCSNTKVADLAPLAGLDALQSLHCSRTQVADIAPLAGLAALQSLDCSHTQVADLAPLAGLDALRSLHCHGCTITRVPDGLWAKPSLAGLYLLGTRLPGVPPEVLSQGYIYNCLPSLRAHLRDLAAGSAAMPDVKLMVLGNGRVGKTQICRRLRNEGYDGGVPSTHGILVTSALLPPAGAGDPVRLHIWDFGGQEIYHGTHALFLRSRALFLLAWTPELERAEERPYDGVVFRSHPLAYWLDYVRHLSGGQAPVLIVQTQCDRPEDDAVRPPVPDEALAAFPFRKVLHYSARENRGRAALDEALGEAVAWLREREGAVVIGAGRARVQRRLEAMRDADAALPPEERRHRTLSQEHFRQLCQDAGDVSAPDRLLDYLSHAGIVFYRRGLFEDRILLDQGWALEAIYAVLHRESCYRQLRLLNGRFSRSLLALLVWQDHSPAEQELFLSMMQSCGICFVHRRRERPDGPEAEYIAPDLLPERGEIAAALEEKWDPALPTETATFDYPFLHPGLVRGIVARIGGAAGINALYWRGGVCVYERTLRSRALIEQDALDGWRGRIRLQTQSGRAAELLQRLTALIEEEERRSDVAPLARSATPPRPGKEEAAPRNDYGQEPSPAPELCVSYAWGDDTPEGREREAVVDRLCAAAEARGIRIIRDKTAMGLGDSITRFMQRISGADRVYVVLSEKYLRSEFCMFELLEVWRKCGEEPEAFLDRVRVFIVSGTPIWKTVDRARRAAYWQEQLDDLAGLIRVHGAGILSAPDFARFKQMQDFAGRVGDILALVTDRLMPTDAARLEEYWMRDLGGAG